MLQAGETAPAKPAPLPYTLRDGGLKFTLLELTRSTSQQEPGVRARLRVTEGGTLRREWQPVILRLHIPGKSPVEPTTIYTVPGKDLDLRFQAPLVGSQNVGSLEVEFRREQGFPPGRLADYRGLAVPRRMGSVETHTRNTALGGIELRVVPARLTAPRAGDPTHYLEAVVKVSRAPAPKPANGGVRPGKLFLRVVQAAAEQQPIAQLAGQMATIEAKTEKYVFPFRLSAGERQLNILLALERGKSVRFPLVHIRPSE